MFWPLLFSFVFPFYIFFFFSPSKESANKGGKIAQLVGAINKEIPLAELENALFLVLLILLHHLSFVELRAPSREKYFRVGGVAIENAREQYEWD